MPAQEFDLRIDRNTTFTLVATVSANGSPMDLTGYAVRSEMNGSTDYIPGGNFDFSPTITDAAGGEITITMTTVQTATLSNTEAVTKQNKPLWDLLIDDQSGQVDKILEGRVSIEETQTP